MCSLLTNRQELQHHFLLQLGSEISLKGKKTRHRFIDQLVHNLADALASAGIRYEFHRRWSRILLSASEEKAGEIVAQVFGIRGVARIQSRRWNILEDLLEHGERLFTPSVSGRRFAVRFHRGERASQVPFTSQEAERALGARLFDVSAGVDLTSPEVEAHVELRGDEAYFYGRPELCEGGLPVGTEGRALALISGGFDSPVAAWSILRRGVCLDYLFCNLGGDEHVRDVLRVLKSLAGRWSHGSRPRVFIVDFRPVVAELQRVIDAPYWQILLKRQMVRAAAAVAESVRALALVTGESIGQVSSQTLRNLAVIQDAVRIPILRPLVAWNKDDIFSLARRIGTFELSEKVPEHCGLDVSKPLVGARPSGTLKQEERLDPSLLMGLVKERVSIDIRAFELPSRSVELETAEISPQAVVLDLRAAWAFKAWHHPGARWVSYPEILESFGELEPKKPYVAYCEVGLKSAHLAEVMVAAGFDARHIAGGVSALRRRSQGGDDAALRAALSPVTRDP